MEGGGEGGPVGFDCKYVVDYYVGDESYPSDFACFCGVVGRAICGDWYHKVILPDFVIGAWGLLNYRNQTSSGYVNRFRSKRLAEKEVIKPYDSKLWMKDFQNSWIKDYEEEE